MSHRAAMLEKELPFRPLGELIECDYPQLPAAWIKNRDLLRHRKWSPSSRAALHVAVQAVMNAGWTASDLRDACLILGTSRGSAAGWLDEWKPNRRAFPLMAASNTMQGEAAAAISIELGICGPYQVVSTGCSAGVDALGIAAMHLQCGFASKALVVAVDLPLVKKLLDSYASTGILSKTGMNDPYNPETSGIFPAECAAAMTLEIGEPCGIPRLLGYHTNSDAADPLSLSVESGKPTHLITHAIKNFGAPVALCPHATGTLSHAKAEPQMLAKAFPGIKPSLHLLKPYLGHGIGAGSLLETVILTDFLRYQQLPPNLPKLSCPAGFRMPDSIESATGVIFKIAASLGGHNALVALGY